MYSCFAAARVTTTVVVAPFSATGSRFDRSSSVTLRVLAVDQIADERAQKATVAKSVTLEVDTVDAQKLWLASSVGSLSLMLRKAGETAEVRTRKVTLEDLANHEPVADKGETTTITVTRAAAKQNYTVPAEGRHGVSAETERRSVAR